MEAKAGTRGAKRQNLGLSEPSEAKEATVASEVPVSAARSEVLASPVWSWTRPRRCQARRLLAGREAAAGLVAPVGQVEQARVGVLEVPVALAMQLHQTQQAPAALVAKVALAATVALEGLAETVAEGARVSAFLPMRR